MPPFGQEVQAGQTTNTAKSAMSTTTLTIVAMRQLDEQLVGLLVLIVVHRLMAFGWIDMHSTPLIVL